jgi:hypothetical protein
MVDLILICNQIEVTFDRLEIIICSGVRLSWMVYLILICIQIELTFDRLEIIMRHSISVSGWETRASLNADLAGHLGAFVSCCTHRA